MNNKRRKELKNIINNLFFDYSITEAIEEFELILDDEENAYYNIPENLLYSYRAEESLEAIDNIREVIDLLSQYETYDKNEFENIETQQEIEQIIDLIMWI